MWIKTKTDWSDMKEAERKRKGEPVKGNSLGPIGNSQVPSYKKGGLVKKTGLAKLHAGEKVIPKQNVKHVDKAVRKYSGK